MYPVGFDLVLDATRRRAHSALPDAPVLDEEPTGQNARQLRLTLANALRAVATRADAAADRVQPLTVPGCSR